MTELELLRIEGLRNSDVSLSPLIGLEGGVRPILTSLHKDSRPVPYAEQRARHSARAAARLALK
jgi:hypothetical protein